MSKPAVMCWCFGAILFLAMHALPSTGQLSPVDAPSSPCNPELFQLLPCFDFLTNSTVSSVARPCCDALANVSLASPQCLCSFLDPSNADQGAALGINDTRAVQLPTLCGLNLDPSECSVFLGPAGAPEPTPVAGGPVPTSSVPAPGPPGTTTPSNGPAPPSNCASVTSKLAPCLGYLENTAPAPSTACCNSLSAVTSEPDCLCNLVNSPPPGINTTAAFSLPLLCEISVLSLDRCSAATSPNGPGGGVGSDGGVLLAKSSMRPLLLALAVVIFFWSWIGKELFR